MRLRGLTRQEGTVAKDDIWLDRSWDDRATSARKQIWGEPPFLNCQIVHYARKQRIVPVRNRIAK